MLIHSGVYLAVAYADRSEQRGAPPASQVTGGAPGVGGS